MNPNSLTDYLTSNKMDATPESRAKLYEEKGLGKAQDYLTAYNDTRAGRGNNADLNLKLLNKLKGGPSIVSTVPVHQEAQKNSGALDTALKQYNINYQNPDEKTDPNAVKLPAEEMKTTKTTETSSDPYMGALEAISQRSNDSTKMLISNIQAVKQRRENKINEEFENYKGGLQLLGIQTNKAQATPDLLMGQIKQAENQHMDKLLELDAEETKALMEAENARADNDFKILKEKMDYVKEVKKAKADELKNMYDTMTQTDKALDITAHDIYDTLYTLDPADQEAFLIAVAKKFNYPMGSLVRSLADEKQKREADELKTRNTETIIAKRTGKNTPTSTDKDGKKTTPNTKAAKAAVQDRLNGSRGSDDFVDPSVYKKEYDNWGGTDKEFLLAFPPEKHVNPANTWLPPQLLPKKTKTSTKAPLFK